ncbi:MAG: ABC transporter permease [Clostridium sp.]|nr:ABC transporter permease [Clostridium sp.]
MMAFSKVRNKKLQFTLMAIILFLTSLILSSCLSITVKVSDYVKKYYNSEHAGFVFSYDENQTNKIIDFLEDRDVSQSKSNIYSINKNIFLENSNLDISLGYIVPIKSVDESPWSIVQVEGEKKDAPGKGEIWVQKILAQSENISLGDTIKIKSGDKYKEFKVTACVNDALEPSSIMGLNNFFISNEDSENINECNKLNLISFDTDEKADKLVDDIKENLEGSLLGTYILSSAIGNVATLTSSVLGGIGVIASILIFAVAIVVIRFILWNSILKEYRSIGIYKSLGFSSRKISGIYIQAYGIIGIVAIILGSFASYNIAMKFMKDVVKYIGNYSEEKASFNVILITILAMSVVYIWNLYFCLRRIKNIKPIEALTIGVTVSSKKFKPSLIKNTINPFLLAVNDIFKYKKQNMMIVLIFTFVSFLSLFFINVDNSVASIDKNVPTWFGNMIGELNISNFNKDIDYKEVINYCKDDDRVDSVRFGSYGEKEIIKVDRDKYGINQEEIVYYVYNNYAESNNFNCPVLEGRNPESSDEVCLSTKMMKDANLKVGDSINLSVDGEDKEFLITGKYSSIYNNGYSLRVYMDLFTDEQIDKLDINVLINFKDKSEIDDFSKEVEDKYDFLSVKKVPTDIENGLSDLSIVSPIVKLILSAIIFFSLLNIINIIIINNMDNRKRYGIMKALGFSSSSIIKCIAYRIAIVSLTGISLGYVIHHYLSAIIFRNVVMGIDGLIASSSLDCITVFVIYALILLVTIISTISIRKISTIELMEE